MEDVTDRLFKYLEAKRHLWNTYFVTKFIPERECSALCDYEEIDRLLFSALVTRDLHISLPTGFVFGVDAVTSLRVIPIEGLDKLNMMVSKEVTTGGHTFQEPVDINIDPDDILCFIEFFEWNRYSYVSYPYYLTRVLKSKTKPELVGKDALIETIYANVFLTLSATTNSAGW